MKAINKLINKLIGLTDKLLLIYFPKGICIRKRMVIFFLKGLGLSKLSLQQRNLLARMQNDNNKSKEPFKASKMWSEIKSVIEEEMHLRGINDVEDQIYNTVFSQSLPASPRYYRYALWMLYKVVKSKDKYNLLNKIKTQKRPDSKIIYEFDGHKVWWDYLITLDTLYSIEEYYHGLFTNPIVLADLGAGWGRIGYFLKLINPKCSYIAIDLPEPLLLASCRLSQLLPKENIYSYEDVRSYEVITNKLLHEGGIWFCGPQDMEKFQNKSINVLINISSFQEMTSLQVKKYLQIIDMKVEGMVYVQEYWKHARLHRKYNTISDIKKYSFPRKWHKLFLRNTSFSERYFEALFSIN
jgi:putative sugar O-methyltransferase